MHSSEEVGLFVIVLRIASDYNARFAFSFKRVSGVTLFRLSSSLCVAPLAPSRWFPLALPLPSCEVVVDDYRAADAAFSRLRHDATICLRPAYSMAARSNSWVDGPLAESNCRCVG